MYPHNSIYLGLNVVLSTLGPQYILVGYMDPQGSVPCMMMYGLNTHKLMIFIRAPWKDT